MSVHADEVRVAAANPEHEWDRVAIDWPLTSDSVVVEVGGYKGRWALQIAERYHSKLYVFEPQRWAYDVCCEVLGHQATVLHYGLGTVNAIQPMERAGTDGCTFVTAGPCSYLGLLREIGEAFAELGILSIDLLLMNIEGYEYTLLPHMLERGILPKRLMIQFHTFADPNPDGKTHILLGQALAMVGYRLVWTYGEVLTAWERMETTHE